MLAEERQQMILTALKDKNILKLQEICELTNCSESSARRDLQLLEQRGALLRVHGGAKVKHSLQQEPDMTGKSLENIQQKKLIAKQAAELIKREDVIYLDAGTSTLAMIQYLNADNHLTVVTNGVVHASVLADRNIRTILIGGELKNTTKAIVGVQTVRELLKYRFDKVFLGMNGIHVKYGFTTPDPDEAAVKTTASQQGNQTFILADDSKFSQVSFVKVADLAAATIITNKLPRSVFNEYNAQTNIQEVSL
ncbi:MAG: DeoR/GlpR family DNA-binding transcription regulator [Liquorilactobacillus nagelii]|uniref:DeoR family transcriptional regulator n=1 Tax=Liquorilactobacillus nagelii TaxID=82688 RepID=A0A3Q8CE02_9LACO|nr:DeoR/GlpR family DNA-binding transcription regulator [Liquorilactobacillus nagelii]AUJ31143.1 DeoR family transcriptional regulator [Liquorilactobacillus nagelii]KRL42216.1 DeoR family transcriptional regulator [Liquorilactobacillus nagelii DSM 13675]MCC7616451.1 DeoR/GlpR transcriptional regulator [Liquorilactobacillus nagelii]MCI1633646.1 DeoR/GlpR family DNA-binding transcription regulator [Liquorilactobacillus nagelii]MCI1699058.1 DeoR/GlpR family DNA-binding transcription regulator [Li